MNLNKDALRKIIIGIIVLACIIGGIAGLNIEPATSSNNTSAKSQTTSEDVTSELPVSTETSTTEIPTSPLSSEENIETSTNISESTSNLLDPQSTNNTEMQNYSETIETSQANTQAAIDIRNINCTISISCKVLVGTTYLYDNNNPQKEAYVPSDGMILPETSVIMEENSTVYDVLYKVCRDNSIHLETSYTPVYNSYYIEGINHIYEFDAGSGSGWMYTVNNRVPNYGSSSYILSNNDVICFIYTCNLGDDIN